MPLPAMSLLHTNYPSITTLAVNTHVRDPCSSSGRRRLPGACILSVVVWIVYRLQGAFAGAWYGGMKSVSLRLHCTFNHVQSSM